MFDFDAILHNFNFFCSFQRYLWKVTSENSKESYRMYTTMCSIDTLESKLVDRERVAVSLEMLLELKGDQCNVCKRKLRFNWHRRGAVKTLKWSCPSGHVGRWC